MKEQYVLAIDVAKGKSMVSLISSCVEVLIEPYELNHSLNDLNSLHRRIINLNILNDTAIIMESTGIYGMPIKRFFLTITIIFILSTLFMVRCIKII